MRGATAIIRQKQQQQQITSGPLFPYIVAGSVVAAFAAIALVVPPRNNDILPHDDDDVIHVAFIGNSMMYYNDFPRFMETLSNDRIEQNSCLHGDASLHTILVTGNGMYDTWRTGAARVYDKNGRIYDFGACTVPQLLFGYDGQLERRVKQVGNGNDDDDNNNNGDGNNDQGDEDADDFFSFYDGLNPCLRDPYYLTYLDAMYQLRGGPPEYDFVVLNDNTRGPARYSTRKSALKALKEVYIPWFQQMKKATPVFVFTYGYWTPYRDMYGLVDVPTFTSLTYQGYLEYMDIVGRYLPAERQPRLAPVGVAYLIVYEENRSMWHRLFHVDKIHPSPAGTFLQGCVVHYTLFGVMPAAGAALRQDPASLWQSARSLQPGEHRPDPYPTLDETRYLYDVAIRVVRYGHMPKNLTIYDHQEALEDYEPHDDIFRIDDLF